MVNIKIKRGFCRISKVVVEYNTGKTAIDLSDQMNTYSNPLRKTIEWYRKLTFELFLNTAVVNALLMFHNVTGSKMSITTFCKQLADVLTRQPDEEIPIRVDKKVFTSCKEKRRRRA